MEPTPEFEEFFRAEYPNLVRSLYLLTADLGDAEELSQEAMAKMFERWERVRAMGSPGGYAYRTAVNLNRKRLRHLAVRARRLFAMSRDPAGEPEPETRADLAAALRALQRRPPAGRPPPAARPAAPRARSAAA